MIINLMINTYESIFICPGEMTQEKIEAAMEKTKAVITRSDGKIVTAEFWGRRKLAYPIDHNRDGFYSYLIFSSSPSIPALLDRHYKVTDAILRGLTVKVDPRHLEKIRPAVRAATADPTVPPIAGAPADQETQGVNIPGAPQAESAPATEEKTPVQ